MIFGSEREKKNNKRTQTNRIEENETKDRNKFSKRRINKSVGGQLNRNK